MSDAFREYLRRRDEASIMVIDFIQNLRTYGWRITGDVATAKDYMYAALGDAKEEERVFNYIAENLAYKPIEMPWGIKVYLGPH